MNKPPSWLACTIAGANILAVLDMPYGYYQFLRLIVTGYAGYVSYVYFRRGPSQWGWAFGTVALLYNPLFLVTMSKEFHTLVNLAVAGLVVFEFYKLRKIEQPPASVPEVKEVPKTAPPPRSATHSEEASGGFFRVVFPPLLALAIGVGIIAAVTYVNSTQGGEDADLAQAEASPIEYPRSDDATPLAVEFPALDSSLAGTDVNQTAPTSLEFTAKIDSAVSEFARIYKAEGLSGAQMHSRDCQSAAQQSYDILDTDYCTAFDMAGALLDYGVATDLGMPVDEYFKTRATAVPSDYARFSQASENRTELIWQEVKSTLPSAMQ